ncbi:hypothetical protein DENSPDRAFT_672276 [Dentipellis sp. KUC8613]|nr:hypothetical protein DENSPDRAFT_672276 [Dentipellis sp. KUC8613]
MHRASALAVALRKLNASYAKRTRELAGARERVGTLEGEIEDAWRVAEEVALEVDRLRAEVEGYRKRERDRLEAGVQTDEVAEVSLQVTSPTDSVDASVEDEGWEEATVDGLSIISQDLTMVSRAQVVDVMGTAVVSQARLTTVDDAAASPPRVQSPTPTFGPPRTPVTASVPPTSAISAMAVEDERTSTHSRSASMPIADRRLSATSQLSRVTAARKRSMRASKASLRMPRGWTRAEGQNQAQTSRGRSRSKSRRRSLSAEPAERPPLPDLPVDVGSSASVRAGSGSEVDVEVDDKDATMSFLDMNMESKAHTDDEGAENVTMENVGQEIIGMLLFPSFLSVRLLTMSPAPPQSPSLVHPYSAGLTTPRPPRPRSPTTPTLLSSYASPRSPTASQSTSSLAPTATLQTSASMRISHTSHGSHGSMGKGKGKAFAHMSAMSLFGHALGTEEDEEGDEVTEMGGLLGRRGNSLDLPATTGSVGRASMLKRSMSDLLRFGKGKGRRRSVPVQSSLGPGAVGVRVNEGTVS